MASGGEKAGPGAWHCPRQPFSPNTLLLPGNMSERELFSKHRSSPRRVVYRPAPWRVRGRGSPQRQKATVGTPRPHAGSGSYLLPLLDMPQIVLSACTRHLPRLLSSLPPGRRPEAEDLLWGWRGPPRVSLTAISPLLPALAAAP